MSSTPNKGYTNQATESNSGTWGLVLNQNFSDIDSNLGGTLTLSVAGNTNVTLTSAQAQNLIYNFTGVLTGNINVIFPAAGGLYFINNQTTGNFTLTIQAGTSVNGLTVTQGTQAPIYVDNSTNPPTVGGASGTQSNFTAVSVGGTANALTVSATIPSAIAGFTLLPGTLLTFTPNGPNSGSATLNALGSGAATIQKVGPTGLINLAAGDLETTPVIAQWSGIVWIYLNIVYSGYENTVSTNQSINFGSLFTPFVNTAPITYTIAQTTTLAAYWYIDIFALGGAATIAINAADKLNGGTAGVGLTMPQGSSGRITTDANGNLYLNGTSALAGTYAPLASPAFTGIPTAPTASAGANTTQIATTAFVIANGSAPPIIASTRNAKMSVTSASASATFTADEIIVQISLGGLAQNLSSYSQGINLAATGAGGMDTGAAPASGYVSLYAIAKADGTKNILACNVTTSSGSIYSGANMPSGYTYSALIGVWPTNGSSQFIVAYQIDRRLYRAKVDIVNTTGNTSYSSGVSITGAVPPNAKTWSGIAGSATSAGNNTVAVAADTNGTAEQIGSSTGSAAPIDSFNGAGSIIDMPIIAATSAAVFWKSGNGNNVLISITNYTF